MLGALAASAADIAAQANATPTAIEGCMQRMLKLTGSGPFDAAAINAMSSTCEQISSSAYRAETLSATARIYEGQLAQNTVMLWLVVAMTLAGVALAALQLWATYRLAKTGQAALADGGEASLEHGKVVVRSSVVGVIILALSFAFFTVYVLYVYRLTPFDPNAAVPTQSSEIVETAPPAHTDSPAPPGNTN